MKNLFVVVLVLFLFACKKEITTSDCINEKIEKYKTEARASGVSSIVEYKYENQLYYTFDYGAALDWPMYLLDNQCDTVCTFSFLPSQKCKIDDFFTKATKVKVVFE
ncbi:MAG: hypothetical protein RLZZ292_2897 [Bacteroidota bacterium]|jgi:hypothetical protein